MNLTTIAAFTAAGLALVDVVVNVFWGSRLTSRAQVEQWRRNEERPIVARILTLSEDARALYWPAFDAKQKWVVAMRADPDGGSQEDTKV